LLQAVDPLSLAQALDVTALQQTLEELQLQEFLLVEHQASVDAHLEVIQQQVQDLLAQGRMDSVVTLAEERTQQDCSITQTLVLVVTVASVVEDNQTVTL
jgi:DNA-binding SARP family transcriptional activator